jgi:hypothetical protein
MCVKCVCVCVMCVCVCVCVCAMCVCVYVRACEHMVDGSKRELNYSNSVRTPMYEQQTTCVQNSNEQAGPVCGMCVCVCVL